MIIVNFNMAEYLVAMLLTFFIIILDSILTNINARLQFEYYRVEILPWVRWAYKNKSSMIGLLLSIISNLVISVIFFLLPIKLSWLLALTGFWIYRLYHVSMRLYIFSRRRRG